MFAKDVLVKVKNLDYYTDMLMGIMYKYNQYGNLYRKLHRRGIVGGI